jgi:hypothetical protein
VTVDPRTQWAPGSPVAIERGCSCDRGEVMAAGTIRGHQAFDPADIAYAPIVDPDCPIHGEAPCST